MAARKIQRVIEVKKGNKWEMTDTWTDEKEIYNSLAHDLIAKKINACAWIKTIKRTYHYDGYQTITVDYGNGVRAQYTVTAN